MLRLRRRERIERLVKRSERLAEPGGRGGTAETERAPNDDADGYGPTDVAAVRALAARRDLGVDLDLQMAPPVARGGLAHALLDAVPHWLTADATPDIRHVPAPTSEMLADLRLPYPAQSVWFGAPADVGPARELLAPLVRADLTAVVTALADGGSAKHADDSGDATDPDLRVPKGTDEDLVGVPWELAVVAAPLLSDRKAAIVGVVLLADEDGRRNDVCCWVLWVPSDDGGVYVPLPARRRLMRNPALVDVATALVAWGGWEVHETSTSGARPDIRPTTSGTWVEPSKSKPTSADGDSSGPVEAGDDTGPIRVLDRGSRIWIEGWRGFHIHHALLAGAPVSELSRAYGLSFGDLEATWHRWAGQQQRLRDPQGRPRLSLADYEKVFGILTRHQPDDR